MQRVCGKPHEAALFLLANSPKSAEFKPNMGHHSYQEISPILNPNMDKPAVDFFGVFLCAASGTTTLGGEHPDMAVAQKTGTKMEPWQVETWTKICGLPLMGSMRFGICISRMPSVRFTSTTKAASGCNGRPATSWPFAARRFVLFLFFSFLFLLFFSLLFFSSYFFSPSEAF